MKKYLDQIIPSALISSMVILMIGKWVFHTSSNATDILFSIDACILAAWVSFRYAFPFTKRSDTPTELTVAPTELTVAASEIFTYRVCLSWGQDLRTTADRIDISHRENGPHYVFLNRVVPATIVPIASVVIVYSEDHTDIENETVLRYVQMPLADAARPAPTAPQRRIRESENAGQANAGVYAGLERTGRTATGFMTAASAPSAYAPIDSEAERPVDRGE